jgi:hypothetical protein
MTCPKREPVPPLLKPDVVVRTNPGEHRQLLATQPRHPPAAISRDTHILRMDQTAPCAQVLTQDRALRHPQTIRGPGSALKSSRAIRDRGSLGLPSPGCWTATAAHPLVASLDRLRLLAGRVVQVRLDGGLGASQPPGDLPDRETLRIAVVARKRRGAAPFMRTITPGHRWRRYWSQPTTTERAGSSPVVLRDDARPRGHIQPGGAPSLSANPEAASRLDSRFSTSGCRPKRERRGRRLRHARRLLRRPTDSLVQAS